MKTLNRVGMGGGGIYATAAPLLRSSNYLS